MPDDLDDVAAAVLDHIQDLTEPNPDGHQDAKSDLWTSRDRLRSDAVKPGTDYDKESLDGALATLTRQGYVQPFHGLLAPATDDHLRAVIQNEQQAENTRRVLIGRCNQSLGAGR